MAVKGARSFVGRLNFWDCALNSLINMERCYNLVGTKTESIKPFLSATMKETNFVDAKVSTLVETFKTILLVASSLAKLYEETASTHYGANSPEHLSRVKHDFIRNEGESWKDDNHYQGVILFPEVALNAQDILGETFKFTQKQVTEMDKVNDVDGRKALMYQTQLTCLAIHLGFGDLASPDKTLLGKTTKTKLLKQTSAEAQKAKDLHEEEGAGNFKSLVNSAEEISKSEAEDDSDEEAFDIDKIKRRRAAKRKKSAEKNAAGAATLGGDAIEKTFLHMTSPSRAEENRQETLRKEAREDRIRQEDRDFKLQLVQIGRVDHSSLMRTPSTTAGAGMKFCTQCGAELLNGFQFCGFCGKIV